MIDANICAWGAFGAIVVMAIALFAIVFMEFYKD